MKTKDGRGRQIPTEKQVDALMKNVDALAKRVSTFAISLCTAERLASLKMRTGGEQVIAIVGELAEQHKVALPDVTVVKMKGALGLAQRLRPAAETLHKIARSLDDTVINATSQSWNAATAFYTVLARSALQSPSIEAGLQPVVDFFSTRKRKKTQPLPTIEPAPGVTES